MRQSVRSPRKHRHSRLAPVDEANLVLDQPGQVNVFLVAGLLAPGGFVGPDGRPDLAVLRSILADRIPDIPSLRMIPVRAGRAHRWQDAGPDLDRHVRLTDPVDSVQGLERLCGDLMTVPMSLERPLWELLIVPGASSGRLGVVLRIHHAIADGMAAVEIVHRLFDPVDGARPPTPAAAATVRRASAPFRRIGRVAFAIRRMWLTLRATGVAPTVLLGDRGDRSVAFLDADLAALTARARLAGATLNDALLAAVTAGYRATLEIAGESIPTGLPISVPVALRRDGSGANRVGVMLVTLPLTERDPDARLRVIAAQTGVEKVRAREQGTLEFMRGPHGARMMNRLARHQHLVAGFVTNVPGPPAELHLAGARVTAMWPVAVVAANVRLGTAAVSYAGRLSCSVQYDSATVPGEAFVRATRAELARLGG